MKIIFKILLGITALVIILLGAVITVWLKPELILTQARSQSLLERYGGSYFSKMPEHFVLGFQTQSFFEKRVHVETGSFCLKTPVACFKQVSVDFAFTVSGIIHVKLDEIGPLEISNTTFEYEISAPKKSSETEPSSDSIWDHLTIPKDIVVKNVHVEFPNISIKNGKDSIKGNLLLEGKERSDVNLEAKVSSNTKLDGSLQMHTSFLLEQENPFDAKIHLHAGGFVDGTLKGKVTWSKLDGQVSGNLELKKFTPWLNTVYIKNINLTRTPEKIHLGADLETKLEQKLGFGNVQSVLPKATFDLNVHGKIEASSDKNGNRYQVDLGPSEDKGIVLLSKASGVFPFPKKEAYKFGLNHFFFKLNIPAFQTLVQSFKKTNYAVPAPFSSLKGKVLLEIGHENGELTGDLLPIRFITDLTATEQSIQTESNGTLTFAPPPKKVKITGESKIKEIHFTMPDLKVLEPAPLVKNDPRLVTTRAETKVVKKEEAEGEEKKSETNLDIEWKITTSTSGIKIFHPVLKPYAPIEINWTIGEDAQGKVSLNPFEIEYLNRIAKVEKLKFYQNTGDNKLHYEGKIVVQKTEYTVFVDIIQDGDKPKVVLTSDPPLEESDIVSVLLFNQTAAELDSDQTSSVASTQSAVASRALGLFSILALSSTPIEAVNFNPTTGVYSARVKLANGLTATIGTDWDKNQEVALRKRLGKNFVLSAILETQTDPITNSSSETRETLIEWFKRF